MEESLEAHGKCLREFMGVRFLRDSFAGGVLQLVKLD